MRLFICHVSEDQVSFVTPLADALSIDFKVWYSEYELGLGDSLLGKITDGLRSADFGIVVLSEAFFKRKKWSEAELRGLFALETESRKVILPIRYGVTTDEVTAYSPILGDRLSVSADEGLPKVVEEIKLAVGMLERGRQWTALDSATATVRKLEETLAGRRLLESEKGATLVSKSFDSVCKEIETTLSTTKDSPVLRFKFSRRRSSPP